MHTRSRISEEGVHDLVDVLEGENDIDGDIPGHFSRLIQWYGLTPEQLRIEITETVLIDDPGLLISATEQLRELEAQIAEAAKTAEATEALKGEIAELKAQGESERIDFKL